VLLFDEKPYFIDMGQSVLLSHPFALTYLERDIKNVTRFFAKLGVKRDVEEIKKYVTGEGDAN